MARRKTALFADLNISSPFDNLPLEIMSHILSYLPHESLKSARLVCFKWYMASLTPRLLDKDEFLLKGRGSGRILRVLPITSQSQIKNSKREFFHLVVEGNRTAQWFDAQFFTEVGHKLRSLVVQPCVTSFKDLCVSLNFLQNLKHLSIDIDQVVCRLDDASAIASSPITVLEKLETLELTKFFDNNIGIVQMMVSIAPNLKSIHMKEAMLLVLPLSDLMTSLKSFPDRVFDVTALLLNTDVIKISIIKRRNQDPELNVRLRALTTVGCPDWIYSWNPSYLTDLEVFKGLNNNQFALICTSFPNLEKLTITHLRHVTAGGEKLASLKKLRLVSLRAAIGFDDEILLAGLCSEVNTTLKEVSFHFMKRATAKFFIEFARTHPAVTHLTIDSCDGVNDRSVQAFFKYQTSLRVFRMPGCKISDVGLDGTPMDVPWGLNECENPTGHSLARLEDLEELELRAAKVTGSIFLRGARFRNLRMLDLSFSQVKLKALTFILDKHPSIRVLDLSNLPITDRFVGVILKKLPLLERIRLRECKKISIAGIRKLSNSGVSVSDFNQWGII